MHNLALPRPMWRRVVVLAVLLAGCAGADEMRSSGPATDGPSLPPPSSASASVPTASNVYHGAPGNYLKLLKGLKAGDTLVLEPGDYDEPNDVPGLPIFDLNGEPDRPIIVTGPETGRRPVLLGRATYNTIRFRNSSYVIVRRIEVDGRNLGGDGVNAQGVAHHITLEDLVIHSVGDNQQTVAISTNHAPTWNWVIRCNEIIGAGTGMYLGSSDGTKPFIAGLIEHNVIRDTIGYNIEIKHQKARPGIPGIPGGRNSSIVRHNVFSKSGNSSVGSMARPNLLVGHFPLSGPGSDDGYEIYGNFFYENPVEALFQGEGNIAFHHNLLVNNSGDAINIQPHNDVPKTVYIFNNTVITAGTGIRVRGGSAGYAQVVLGNVVFAVNPIQAADQHGNIIDSYSRSSKYVNKPFARLGALDLYPQPGKLAGNAIERSAMVGYRDWNRDFNGVPHDARFRGAYSGEGINPGWTPNLQNKPLGVP